MERPLSDIGRGLRRGEDGIWRTAETARVSYPDDGNRLCFGVEDNSFWFEHRKRCLLALLDRFPAGGTFFDVGGGNGYMAATLQAAGHNVVLVEPGQEGAQNAMKRGVREVVCGRLEDARFDEGSLAAIGLFDVLEHIGDDLGFLKMCHQLQPREGRIYLTVPASPLLWSGEDVLAGHFRRYRSAEFLRLLAAAGYVVEFASHLFAFLIAPVMTMRALPHRLGLGRRQETKAGVEADHTARGLSNRIVRALCERERRKIARGQRIGSGTSLILVARKFS